MASLNHVLHSFITRNENFCCLCYKQVEGSSVNVQDEVVIKDIDHENIKILDVLTFVLGSEIFDKINTFEVLCKQCTHTAVICYKFISASRKNTEVLSRAIQSLSDCFQDAPVDYYDCKTLYVTFDKDTSATQQYYDNRNSTSSTSVAFRRFKSMFDIDSKLNIENKVTIKREIELKAPKKKRRDYFSVPLKTTEMLYDKKDRTTLKCRVCYRTYPSLSNLRNHYIRVHAPKDFKCCICHRKFGSIALLEAHKSKSHCTLICTECGKTFHNRHTLKMHEISHYLKLVCQDCGRVYRSQTTFKKHIDLNICGQKTRASPANAKFTCDYCNKKYTQKVSLRVHIQYEHGNYKGHECKWCKKKFWAQSRLKAHIVKHTQEKNFSCNICGGKFVTKESLLYHTRTHTGEKPYKCEVCDCRFLSASRKADHTKRHHSEVIFKCAVCNTKYTTEVCLAEHMKTHSVSENRPESNHQQSSRANLSELRNNSGVSFQCDVCSVKLTSQVYLDEHKKTHEKSNKQTLELEIPEYDEIFLVSDEDNEYMI